MGLLKQHLLRLGVDALWEGRYYSSGSWSGRPVRKRQPAPLPSGAEGDKGWKRQFRGGPCEAPRLCRAGGGRSRAGPGAVRDGVGAAVGLGGSSALRPADFHQAASPSAVHPSSQPAAGGWERSAGAAPRAGRNLGAGEGVRGVSVASAMLGTVTMAGKAVWRCGCRHTRFAPWAARAAAASRGCGAAGEPRSPGTPGLPTLHFLAGR